MPTPHNAANRGDIARVVLLPGDPLRAKFIAERYLENAVCFTQVRNVLGYTGTFEGARVSVMASGMGIPSVAIYSWELYNHYDVDTIIRIGSAGGIAPQVKLCDLVIAQGCCTDSSYLDRLLGIPGTFAPVGDFGLLRDTVRTAEQLGITYHVGNLLTTDIFYNKEDALIPWANLGVLAVEMEAAGLYANAAKAHKKALAMMTISDRPLVGDELSALERETTFTDMAEVALQVAKLHA